MSLLIDKLFNLSNENIEINGKWYIAKSWGTNTLKTKLKDCFRILINKSRAYHFKQDEDNKIFECEGCHSKCTLIGKDKYKNRKKCKGYFKKDII